MFGIEPNWFYYLFSHAANRIAPDYARCQSKAKDLFARKLLQTVYAWQGFPDKLNLVEAFDVRFPTNEA